jgi:hypothetical protein
MRFPALLILLVFVVCPATADTTAALLTADVAGDRIYITFDGTQLSYKLNATRALQPLTDNTTVLISNSVGIAYISFNPLTAKVRLDVTEQPDANYDISSFLTALTGFATAVAPETAAVKPPSAVQPSFACALDKDLQELDDVLGSKADADGSDKWKAVSVDEVAAWKDGALGLKGVRDTMKLIGDASKRLDVRLAEIGKRWKAVQDEWQSNGGQDCHHKPEQLAAATAQRAPAVETAIADTTAIRGSLNSLLDYLKVFASAADWSGDDFTISVKRPDIGKQATVKITVASLSLALGKTSVAVTEVPKQQVTRSVVLREYSLFPREVGVAVVHSDLRYPTYGTAVVDGKTVVAKADNSANAVTGAVMLNLICRCMGRSSPVFPGLQIGIGTAKDAPSLLGGFVLRFISPSAFSIMGGWQITWAKDLDKLKVGDPVSGTAAIDSDLKLRRLPSAWYIGAQYSFAK